MTDTKSLLDAVDALTKRWSFEIRENNRITRIRHRPRLQMLADAVQKSGSSGGGVSLARERSPIDVRAAQMLIDLQTAINKAAKTMDVPAGEPIPTLCAWYAASLTKVTTDEWEMKWADRLTGWARMIDSTLNPPEEVVHKRPCPDCRNVIWYDKADEGAAYKWPVVSRRWDSGQHGIEHAEAHCRFCGHRWVGLMAIRELAHDFEHADTPMTDMHTNDLAG